MAKKEKTSDAVRILRDRYVKNDPQRKQIIETLRPLAAHRGMEDPSAPLVFGGEPEEVWGDWLQENYYAPGLEGKKIPHYVLMAGGPKMLPFGLQSLLDTVASVGRVEFDTLDELKQYGEKIIRIETAEDPVVKREVILFAPDGGMQDPTYFTDVTNQAGIDVAGQHRTGWVDVDGDGDQDIFLVRNSFTSEPNNFVYYQNNGNGTFTDQTATSGLDAMCFSNNGIQWSPWEDWATTRSWDLSSFGGNMQPGSKEVHLRVRDRVGNVADSETATVEYDPELPDNAPPEILEVRPPKESEAS